MFSYHKRKCDYDGSQYASNWFPLGTKDMNLMATVIGKYVNSVCVWKGGQRKKENFLYAEWLSLDFDGGVSLQYVKENLFCDMKCLIGTSRNHLKPKHGVIAERFHVYLKLTKPITDMHTYEHKAKELIDSYGADTKCGTAAAYLFPSNVVFINPDGYTEDHKIYTPPQPTKEDDVVTPTYDAMRKAQYFFRRTGRFTGWLQSFLEEGAIPKWRAGRNDTCYVAALRMLSVGLKPAEVIHALKKAPFDKKGFRVSEYETTVKSALKYIRTNLEKEDNKVREREASKDFIKSFNK